jgi:DUF971 family protein
MTIKRFIINKADKTLSLLVKLTTAQDELYLLPFEYLRISSPLGLSKKTKEVISHKKQVLLLTIEPVAKHGYRFIFDDQHSEIYSDDYLMTLVSEQDIRWQSYLDDLKSSGHSREAMIMIKEV